MRRLWLPLLLSLLSLPAHADKLARGMVLRLPKGEKIAELSRGDLHVTLDSGTRDLKVGVDLDVDAKHERVTVTFEGNCGGDDVQKYTYDELEAMLEEAAADKLKDAHAAAVGFAKAVALDPKNLSYQKKLATALIRDGQPKPAVEALRGAMRDHPLLVYTWAKGELAPLAAEPELTALTAGPPGNLQPEDSVGYDVQHGWIAVRQETGSVMAENVGGVATEILGPTGQSLLNYPDDKLLTALGFDGALDQAAGQPRQDDDPNDSAHVVWSAKLEKAGIAVICSDKGVLRVLSRNQVLGENEHASCAEGMGSGHVIYLVPHAIVSRIHVVIGEGCGGDTFTEYQVTPLTQPGPPAMEALLGAAAADQAARAGKLAEAEAAYARAIALVPGELAYTRSLAAVLVREHKLPEAIRALERLPAADRLFTIEMNPDLAPLATAAEIVALHAGKPGTAHDFTGYQAAGRLVSFLVERDYSDGHKSSSVRLVDLRSGASITELPIGDRAKPAGKARRAAALKVLVDMGFDGPLDNLIGKDQPKGDPALWRAISRSKKVELSCTEADYKLTATLSGKPVTFTGDASCGANTPALVPRFSHFFLLPSYQTEPPTTGVTAWYIVPYRP